jgi:hypothetical protein
MKAIPHMAAIKIAVAKVATTVRIPSASRFYRMARAGCRTRA